MTIFAEIDRLQALYQAERARTLEAIKELAHERFDRQPTKEEVREWGQDPSSVGEVACGQDEFGWWRATVKLWTGIGPKGDSLWRELTYQARSSAALVLAVRHRKEAA